METVSQLDGYGDIVFPHCACDARKEGHVIAIVCFSAFKLQACKEDGISEVRCQQLAFLYLVSELNFKRFSLSYYYSSWSDLWIFIACTFFCSPISALFVDVWNFEKVVLTLLTPYGKKPICCFTSSRRLLSFRGVTYTTTKSIAKECLSIFTITVLVVNHAWFGYLQTT